jgi:hypothetical protein
MILSIILKMQQKSSIPLYETQQRKHKIAAFTYLIASTVALASLSEAFVVAP